MKFEPKTKEQIAREGLLEKGVFPYEVIKAEDAVSKSSGADMIALKLCVYLPDGGQRHINDYLLASMAAKLRHFCESLGLLDKYEAGTLCAEDCMGRNGEAFIVIQEDKTGQYPPRNAIRDYVVPQASDVSDASKSAAESRESKKPEIAQAAAADSANADDDLPF